MKAFLLAGGLGTRLLPLTERVPKCLLPIKGVPMLQIWFGLCRQYGIEEILINVHRHGDIVTDFVAEHAHGLRVRVYEEKTLLGSAGTVRANRDWIRKDPSFWIFYADVLTTIPLNEMFRFHNARGQVATIGVCDVPNPSRCGIVQVDAAGIVQEFVEKPKMPIGSLAFAGIMIGTAALIKNISDKCPVDFGFDVLPHIVGQMAAYRIKDFLIDIGTPETYGLAQTTWPGVPSMSNFGAERC